MGISEGGEGGGIGVDCSVGTIVWVRRRNGSWWPGRILGPDELSASHLMSPRSGTPVKLLGREDASVDWYNLEKSKRVKAFRCGEFGACIERAEAAQGVPIKKREKYARREDAILHALELEKKQQKSGVSSNSMANKPSGTMKKEFNSSSETSMRNEEPGVHGKHTSHKTQMLSGRAGLSHEEENIGNSMYINKGKNDNQVGLEEDIPENVPRMRGLQDFGLRIAPSKRKPSESVDNHMDISNAGHIVGGASHSGSSKNILTNKKTRSHGGMFEESLVKKRDRRRPLNQVLQSSTKLPSHSFQPDRDRGVVSMRGEKDHTGVIHRARRSGCIYLPADSNDSLDHGGYPEKMPGTQVGIENCLQQSGTSTDEYASSGLMEVDESDFSGKAYLETDIDNEANLLGDTTKSLASEATGCEPSANQVSEKFTYVDNNEVPPSSHVPQVHPQEHTTYVSADIGKWRVKGKRNTRHTAKRHIDVMDGKLSVVSSDKHSGFIRERRYETKGSSLRMGTIGASSQHTSGHGFYNNKEFNYAGDEVDLIGKDLGRAEKLTGYGKRRYSSVLKAARGRGRSHISFKDLENDAHMISPSVWKSGGPSHVGRRAYREDSDKCYKPVYASRLSDRRRPMLFDVDLKVQASYQGERVPLVSLMSRLNGKPIVGHPVQIEMLEDGSTDPLVSRNVFGVDERTAPPPVWRTARRTAMQRVPRSNPSVLDGEDSSGLRCTDRESKPSLKKYSGHFNQQAKLGKKSLSQSRRPASGKSHKKSSRRVTLSSQKTRPLSSIGTESKPGGGYRGAKPVRGSRILGGLIQPEETVPLVTCVPVKVAFSRIREAVGRSSLADRVRVAGPAVKDIG
ncbi:uncharacterized protein At1g51745-like [Phoenix dactylifera]|uniref:Uncharacterized protein At1g51745-like n=1 Tax=Phoenix dactylifera TaxID=42345 RepID=A0A8B7CIS5_PHODC|nr:uncharacterized protein At1g51745-like [Phoenix dactylifera]